MPVNFSTLLYGPCQDMYSVPVTFTPVASQPGAPAYSARGIYTTDPIDVEMEDESVFSDQRTILDIRDAEFAVLPQQRDLVNIPLDCNGAPLGDFEILDADSNGGGETTLTLRRIVPAKP